MNKTAPTPEQIASVRAIVDAVAEKAKADRAFGERLRAEPVATLRAEGLPDDALAELLETGDDVGGCDATEAKYGCNYFTTVYEYVTEWVCG